jgi:hypothetical protein
MRVAIMGLLLALVALVAVPPSAAVAAKNQKTAFTIKIQGAWKYGQDTDTYPIDWKYDFRASGAISDSGTWWGAGDELLLLGGKAAYRVVLTPDPGGSFWTFDLYDDATGELLGTGTVTDRHYEFRGRWSYEVWDLAGTLIEA